MIRGRDMKKSRIAIISILLILCLLAFSSCATTARWQNQYSDTDGENVGTVNNNPSAKYIVYAALDGSGNLISAGSATETVEYAVVGYTGLVAELTIPSQYDSKNVTKVLVAAPYSAYKCYSNGTSYTDDDARLANNTVVKSITFGSNVEFVGAGVCAGMINVETVSFLCTTGVEIGANAFAACSSLTAVSFACSSASAVIGAGNFTGITPTYAS